MRPLLHRFPTALGDCGVAWNEAGLTTFRLPGEELRDVPTTTDSASEIPKIVRDVIGRVRRHLRGELQDFRDVQYAWDLVSTFQAAVYRATLDITPGRTASYGEIATTIGEPLSSSRAVAAALGANRWPLLVPCHRIVGADGKMTGFSGPGGIKTKLRLLTLEGAQLFAE